VEQIASPGYAVNVGSFSPRGTSSPQGDVSPAVPHSTPVAYQVTRACRGNSFRGSVGGSIVNVPIPTALPATSSLNPVVNMCQIPTALPAISSPQLTTSSPRLSTSSPRHSSASSIPPSATLVSVGTNPRTEWESVASLSSRLHSNMTSLHTFANQLTYDVRKVCEMTPLMSENGSRGASPFRSPGQSPTKMVLTQGPALELDVSGITSDEPSNLVTFDGATDPAFFTKNDSTGNTNSIIIEAVPVRSTQRLIKDIHDVPAIPSAEGSACGSMPSLFGGSMTIKPQSRSATSSPVTALANRTTQIEDRTPDISQVTISPTQDSPLTVPRSPSKAEHLDSVSKSTWATAGLTQRTPWVPAITSPTYFWRHDERKRSSSRIGVESPPSSACSTPRRRRGKCFNQLHADAAEREKRRRERKEALESDSESQLQASRESSLRATRRYKSCDTRSVLEKTEEHLRRKAELQRLALVEKKKREEEELKECTFKPASSHRKRPHRVPDERELERHLRQLAHKQLDVKARLVQLEYEWLRSHAARRELISEKFKALQSEKKQEVFDLLRTREGQTYYWDRVQRLADTGSMTRKHAQSAVLYELLEDQRQTIQKQATEEVDNDLQFQSRDLDFWTRRNVLLESLDAIETRASSSLQVLANITTAFAIIKASGFTDGLAKQMRDNPPDPKRGEFTERMASFGSGSAETFGSSRTRSQSPFMPPAALFASRDTAVTVEIAAALDAGPLSRHTSTVTTPRRSQTTIGSETLQRTMQPPIARVLSTTATRMVSTSSIQTAALSTPSSFVPPVLAPSTPSSNHIQGQAMVASPQVVISQPQTLAPSTNAVPIVRQISAGSDFMPPGQHVITRKSLGADASMPSFEMCTTPRRH